MSLPSAEDALADAVRRAEEKKVMNDYCFYQLLFAKSVGKYVCFLPLPGCDNFSIHRNGNLNLILMFPFLVQCMQARQTKMQVEGGGASKLAKKKRDNRKKSSKMRSFSLSRSRNSKRN